ncbi:MAG: efflux RND transporter periplasmic adaptor subunit [Candidatus Nealsonbacteria bacterium]|nr:efflux RND transporter periplasmic adaptor subunit [Candidatus Nealsonbacteria bacterium]
MKKKPIILIIIVLILILLGSYKFFFGVKKEVYNFDTAKIGNVVQEVSAVGRVQKGELINLGLKDVGKIDKIYIKVGDDVKSGEKLLKIETTQLSIQLVEAKAALDLANSELNKLLVGETPEKIKVIQTGVDNAKITYENAKQSLTDITNSAEENLNSSYEDALIILEDSYLKAYNAFNSADLIKRTYFTYNDQESINFKEKKEIIENLKNQIKYYLDLAKADPKSQNIDIALTKIKDNLDDIYDALSVIRNLCEGNYRDIVSSTDKTYLDTHKTNINTVLASIVSAEQSISSTKLTNNYNINTAKASVLSTEGAFKKAQDEMSLMLAGPRQEDIDLYRAKKNQAGARLNILENQIAEAVLKSPVDGKITKINKEIGEQVLMGEAVISLIPAKPFQVETDVSESDIGKIKIGNYIKIILDAFPEEEFSGKVIEIDPAETVIAGVIYYKIKASLESEDERIKPGMTANLTVIIDSKENALVIPQRAVIEKNGKKFTRILKNKDNFEEIEIQTGLRGSSGVIEILSGLKEGDKVITSIKEK